MQDVVSPEVSTLNHSAMNKKHKIFSRKKEDGFITCQSIALVNRFYYKITDPSVLHDFFICIKTFIMQWRKNIKVGVR